VLLRIFKTNQPVSVLFLLLFTFCIKLKYLLNPIKIADLPQNVFGKKIVELGFSLCNNNTFALGFLAITILIIQALYFNYTINSLKLLHKNTLLPAFVFLFTSSFFPSIHTFGIWHITNCFLLYLFSCGISLYKSANPYSDFFRLGLLSAIAAFIHPTALVFIIIIFFCIAINRPSKIQDYLIFSIGFIVPFFLLFTVLFSTHKLHLFGNYYFSFAQKIVFTKWELFWLALLVFTFLIGVVRIQFTFLKQLVQNRKIWILNFISIIVGLLMALFSKNLQAINILFCLFPLSSIISNNLLTVKFHKIAQIVIVIVLILLFINQYLFYI
jgi:hypothetical protein